MSAEPKWSNAKAATVAHMIGQGFNSTAIVKHLDDGTKPSTIRQMARYWGLSLPAGRGSAIALTVHIDSQTRHKLEKQADLRGITPSEFVRRVSVCAIKDDMYDAVVDGAYD